jgi:hypothetical protein
MVTMNGLKNGLYGCESVQDSSSEQQAGKNGKI